MTTAVSLSAIHSHPSTFPPSGCKHGWPSHRADSYFEIALSTHRRGLRKREREREREGGTVSQRVETGKEIFSAKRREAAGWSGEGAFTIHLSGSVCPTQPRPPLRNPRRSTRPEPPPSGFESPPPRQPNDVFVRWQELRRPPYGYSQLPAEFLSA